MDNLFDKTIRYGVTVVCVSLVVFWTAEEPPVLDMAQARVVEGIYNCVWHGGGTRGGPSGAHIVDGQSYYDSFGYIFGVTPGLCSKELNNRKVRIVYLPSAKPTKPLALEVLDVQSESVIGITKERHFSFYQDQVDNKWTFYLSKIGLLLLALRMTCWDRIKTLFQQLFIRTKNHGINR